MPATALFLDLVVDKRVDGAILYITVKQRGKQMIKSIAAAAALGASVFVFADYAFSIPNVLVSYETRQCVQVQNHPSVLFGNTNYTCENMPEKFNHVWVQ